MKIEQWRKWFVGWMWLFALLMTSLAVVGGFKNYSAIPFWDMWNGLYEFILGIQDGRYTLWWSQHNEHRIVLARLLFWIDYTFFDLKAAFLIICNYIFVALTGLVFACFIRNISKESGKNRDTSTVLTLFVLGWLFLWTQKENLTWAFQSQFFLAQLVPLAMFYFLAVSAERRSDSHYFIACLLGILSAGTMANGVVALPLAFLMSCFLPFSRAKRAGLLVLAAAIPITYFFDYAQPSGHGSLTKTLINDPVGILRYTMVYIGSPFHVMAASSKNALLVAELAGGLLVITSVWAAIVWVFSRYKSPYVGALLFFILFIGGTAVGTGGGRLIFGLSQAASERYTTPAVMAWAALLVVGFFYNKGIGARDWRLSGALLFFASIALLIFQSTAVRLNHSVSFERKIGALAVTLGIGDAIFIKQLFPSIDYVLGLGQEIEKRELGFVNIFPFERNTQAIGQKLVVDVSRACTVALNQVDAISMGNGYLRLIGWALDEQSRTVPEKLTVLDLNDQVIGFVLTGKPQKDLRKIFGEYAKRAGFIGYVKTSAQGQPVRLVGSGGDCVMNGVVPRLVFERLDGVGRFPPTVTSDALITNNNYVGHSNVPADTAPHSVIYSSYVNGDRDVGSIELKVKNGDVLMFVTGPVSERQLLKSEGSTVSLPKSGEWTSVRFIGFQDEKLHDVTIEDAGNGWGEWSAIALRNQ